MAIEGKEGRGKEGGEREREKERKRKRGRVYFQFQFTALNGLLLGPDATFGCVEFAGAHLCVRRRGNFTKGDCKSSCHRS